MTVASLSFHFRFIDQNVDDAIEYETLSELFHLIFAKENNVNVDQIPR